MKKKRKDQNYLWLARNEDRRIITPKNVNDNSLLRVEKTFQ